MENKATFVKLGSSRVSTENIQTYWSRDCGKKSFAIVLKYQFGDKRDAVYQEEYFASKEERDTALDLLDSVLNVQTQKL